MAVPRISLGDAYMVPEVELDCYTLKCTLVREYVQDFHQHLSTFYFTPQHRHTINLTPVNFTYVDVIEVTKNLAATIAKFCCIEIDDNNTYTQQVNAYLGNFYGMQAMEMAIYMVFMHEYANLKQLYSVVLVKDLHKIIGLRAEFVNSFIYVQYRLVDILSREFVWRVPFRRDSIVWGRPSGRFARSKCNEPSGCGIHAVLARRMLTPSSGVVHAVFNGEYCHPSVDVLFNNPNVFGMYTSGTACCGKTSALSKALAECKSVGLDFQIISRGSMGGFSGKDHNIARANLCAITVSKTVQRLQCVGDRTEYDNSLWRCIMEIMGIDGLDAQINWALEWFNQNVNEAVLEGMKSSIVVIFINSDIGKVVEMMYKRGEGGDLARLAVPNYVQAQNVVYTIYALMCGFPILNVSRLDMGYCQTYVTKVVRRYLETYTGGEVEPILQETLPVAMMESMDFAETVGILK